jgi:MFS family permease
MLLGSLFAILGGWIADRYNPKVVFMAMGFLSFAGLVLTSQATTLWHLFVSYGIFLAAGIGPIYPIASSITTRWFVRSRGLAIAIISSGVGLGSVVIVPVVAYFIADSGWRLSYLVFGAIVFVIMTPLALFIKKAPVTKQSPVTTQTATSSYTSNTREQESGDLSAIQIIKQKNFVLLIFIWFFHAFCMFMVMTHITPAAIDLHIDPLQAASIISISGFANVPARILMGVVSDRFGIKRASFICAALMVVAMIWLTQSTSLLMFYIFAIAFGAASGGLTPPTSAIVGDTFGVRHIGLLFGILGIGWVCGAALGPALAGYIFDVTGKYFLAFVFGVIAALLMTVLVLFFKISKPQRQVIGNQFIVKEQER